ncbi:MAG: PEP-CTERM sorting domain-containing protein [Phycisphaera sp.]|nr:PEP-CTERM sorting domain-containing protein [Phycisphaera sp.]
MLVLKGRKVTITTALLACLAVTAHAATITQDFESTVAPAVPIGWTTVGVGANGTYATTAGTGNPGQSGNLDWTGANQTAPGVYLVNAGSGLDASQSISGTFDFYVVEDGNYSYINFVMGDVQNGLTNTSAGEFLNAMLKEKTFGARAALYNGANVALINDSSNDREIFTNQWNKATFTWTPTSGTTGDFTLSWVRPTNVTEPGFSITGYTFDSAEVFFGFGTGSSPARFDNINITGTQYVIPEPASMLCLGLGGLTILIGRKKHA